MIGTAGAAVSVYEHETRKHRHSKLQDIYDVARLVDTCEHIHFHVRSLVPRDMIEARDLDVNTAYALLANTTKRIATAFTLTSRVALLITLCDIAADAEGADRAQALLQPSRCDQRGLDRAAAAAQPRQAQDVLHARPAAASPPVSWPFGAAARDCSPAHRPPRRLDFRARRPGPGC